MTAVTPEWDTDYTTHLFEEFDPELPCEVGGHEKVSSEPAQWIVTLRPRMRCCGAPLLRRMLVCDRCLDWFKNNRPRCRRCGKRRPGMDNVVSVDPINP